MTTTCTPDQLNTGGHFGNPSDTADPVNTAESRYAQLFQAHTVGNEAKAGAEPPSKIASVPALLTEWLRGQQDVVDGEFGECRCASVKVHVCYLCGTYY